MLPQRIEARLQGYQLVEQLPQRIEARLQGYQLVEQLPQRIEARLQGYQLVEQVLTITKHGLIMTKLTLVCLGRGKILE